MWKEIALAFAIMAVLSCTVQLFGRYILNYHLTEESLKIVLFGFISVLSVPYRDIAIVQLATFRDVINPWSSWRFGNRIVGTGVLIKKKKFGILYKLIVTPDDPTRFVSDVARRLY
jgi:hypothetical protein